MKKFQKAANITEMIFQDDIKKGALIILYVKGYLGDPSWKLLPETIVFDEDRRMVTIRIFAEKNPKAIAIQVIKDFEKEISFTFPLSGKWTVRCNTNSMEIEVKD
ncbi:MAG: hypothetical protein ACW96U_13165 [Candidatus Heimdallarchaeaceae archaeon]|jgi:hypothetical protein